MVPELLSLLPQRVVECSMAVALTGVAAGALLWLIGARFSRSLVTLLAVAIGTVVGVHLPHWFGWSLDPIGAAFGGAVVLGLSGYLLHRTWVGACLGTVAALWAAVGTWIILAPGVEWDWRSIQFSTQLPTLANNVWHSLPAEVSRAVPAACFGGFACGTLVAVFWPKLGKVLTYSLVGASLLVVMGLPAVRMSRPQWLRAVPPQAWAQSAALLGFVALGTLIQWWLTPTVSSPAPGSAKADAGRDHGEDGE